MAYINEGDLLVVTTSQAKRKVVATSQDYGRRRHGGGEFIDDWYIVPSVDVLDPATGQRSTLRLSEVTKA